MPGDQDNSITGRLKNFLLGNTIATNLALGTVGLFSMPLMGALIGANTAWRKSPPIKASGGWMEWGKSIARKAFTTLLGAVGGASVGIVGTAVVGALTIFGGPVGIVAGMAITGLAASYMGKDATAKRESAPTTPNKPEQKKVQKNKQSNNIKKKKVLEKEPDKQPDKQVLEEARAIVQKPGEQAAKVPKAAVSHDVSRNH